jgi:hypothetical protein
VGRKLDKAVYWLDARLGKNLVDRGMDAFHAALQGTGPANMVQIAESVLGTAGSRRPLGSTFHFRRFAVLLGRH